MDFFFFNGCLFFPNISQALVVKRCQPQVKRALRHLTEASLASVLLKDLHRVKWLPESSLEKLVWP